MTLSDRLISRLRSIDWDFSGSLSESPFSAIHWHPGRFASQLPAALIGLLTRPGDLVVDPFVGSGTTLVEAQRLGRPSLGIDINPISCLIAQGKSLNVFASEIQETAERLKEDAALHLSPQTHFNIKKDLRIVVPDSVQGDKWYTPRVFRALGLLWGRLQEYSGVARTLGDVAFSAILMPVCRETRHWGYVCDNTSPQSEHEGNVIHEFGETLDRLARAYSKRDDELNTRFGNITSTEPATVICGSTVEALRSVPTGSAKLIVTSPPYFGVCDYVKAQRLPMEWFGVDIEPHRRAEIGARSKRHRKTALNDYVSELTEAFQYCRRCLRRTGYLAVVLGQSQKRHPVVTGMKKALVETGFTIDVDINRRVSSQRRQAPSIKGEHVLVMSR